MKSIVYPSNLNGSLNVPGSKSFAQRAIFLAALHSSPSILFNLNYCDDVLVALNIAEALGAEVMTKNDTVVITGCKKKVSNAFHAGESGLSGRILACLLLSYDHTALLSAEESLERRPFDTVLDISHQTGRDIHHTDKKLPYLYSGQSLWNQDIKVDGSISSQFVTGLFITLAKVNFQHRLIVRHLTSRPYVDMTLDLLRKFGILWEEQEIGVFSLISNRLEAFRYTVEADWSSAASLIAAGRIAGNLNLSGLDPQSTQADQAILDLLSLPFEQETLLVTPQDQAFNFDATQSPDLFPALAAIAAYSDGSCRIQGVHRLVHKESNRALAIMEEFGKLGITVIVEGDEMIIVPGKVKSGVVNARNDHRIAMALTCLALRAEGPVEINDTQCIRKSYPNFFTDLISLGARIEIIDA